MFCCSIQSASAPERAFVISAAVQCATDWPWSSHPLKILASSPQPVVKGCVANISSHHRLQRASRYLEGVQRPISVTLGGSTEPPVLATGCFLSRETPLDVGGKRWVHTNIWSRKCSAVKYFLLCFHIYACEPWAEIGNWLMWGWQL